MLLKVYNIGSRSEKVKWFDENLVEVDGNDKMTPDIIGHRIVHGGDKFVAPTLINQSVLVELKALSGLAPLHNLPAIKIIEKCLKQHRVIPNYAVFDTAFYKDLPEVAKRYPLPEIYYSQYGIRKFGFHGLSHQFVVNQINKLKVISIHLGGGASMTAMIDKKPVDTSMGFTPLDGLMMSTRCGSIDTGIVEYLVEEKKLKLRKIFEDLNFESGVKGVSGVSDDFRDILLTAGYKMEDFNYRPQIPLAISEEVKARSRLAIEMYVDRIKKMLGSYVAILNGVDAVIFTGEIGCGSSFLREKILENLDMVKDAKIYVIKTNEEYQIAKEILDYISMSSRA